MMEAARDMTAREKLLEIERLAAEVQDSIPRRLTMIPLNAELRSIREKALDCVFVLPPDAR